MRFFQTYFIVLFLCVHTAAQTAKPADNFPTGVAVPGKANCMLFSQNGFFYAGTTEGLFLFDGIQYKSIAKKEDSISSVMALAERNKDELWIGCDNGAIFTRINNQIRSWKPQEGLPQKPISSIAFDDRDNIWLATKGEGLYIIHNNQFFNVNTDDGLSDNYVYDLEFINGQMVAATDQGISFCSFNGTEKTIKNFNTSSGLADNIVQTLAIDPHQKDILWLGFQNGCAGYFNVKNFQYQSARCHVSPVTSILALDDELLIASEEAVTILNRNGYTEKSKHTLPGVVAMAADAEANVWYLHSTSFFKTNGEQLQAAVTLSPAENDDVYDFLIDDKGNYWITASNGVLVYEPSSTGFQKKMMKLPLHTNSEITSLHKDPMQKIWVGTMGDGVFVIDAVTKKIQHINSIPELQKASILSITGNSKNIWITSLEGVWRTEVNSYKFEKFTTASSTGSAYIYYVLEDSKGRVWFATDGKGITRWQNGTYQSFREKEGLPAKVIYSLAEDKFGNIWCNTLNNGVYKYDGKKFKHFGAAQGLPDLNISSISTDEKGFVFCIAARECFMIDAKTDQIIPLNNSNFNGELNTNLNSSFTAGSRTWFHAGSHIYSWIWPSYKKITNPQTRILTVSLFLDELHVKQSEFAYNENNLSFHFTGFYYSDPLRVTYSYKLDGYNNNWQFTKDGYVNFPKLPPGLYTFRVRSSVNGNFEQASEASYTFEIAQPFWKRWWFVLLSIATVTALLVYIIKTREKEVQKMQQLQTETLKSQYETLKNQVNPHFLFNSFNTLLNVIDEDPKKAAVYVEELSDFYRSIVNMREKDLIPLGDEIKIIEHYFFIQKKRFGDALNFTSDVTEGQKSSYSIPPLSLQLLAENAIKHNIVSKDKPVIFNVYLQSDQLIVKNNLHPKVNAEEGEGLGLQNIKNRFELMTGKEVAIEKTETHFIVTLPLIKVL
jgi:ligand-binding sensor domain-containing protein